MKKLLALGLVSALAVSAVACGGTDNKKASGEDTYKIGAIGPTTGAAAIYGNAVKYGAEIAIEEINAAGGINGVKLELNFQDDENDAEKGINAYNALKDWNMDLLLGTVTSTPSVAVAPETANDGYYMLTPSGSSPEITKGRTNVFQVCFSDNNQGVGAAQYIGENAVAEKVAVIYDSSSVYSAGIYEKFQEEAANQNFEIVAAEAFTEDTKTDFSVQLQKAKESGADLVFLPIYAAEASLVLTQADAMGFDTTFFGCDGLDGILSVKNFNAELAEGVILLTPFVADAEDEATKAFVGKYKEAHGEVPNQFAADAYDGIYIIKKAIEEAEVTVDMTAQDISAKLVEVMPNITIDGLTGKDMSWQATGEVSKAPAAMVIEDGVYVTFGK